MSTSPRRYYDSKPSSRPTSPRAQSPAATPSAADVRSQAVAKLKRAASLPRKTTPRRPSNSASQEEHDGVATGQYSTPERSHAQGNGNQHLYQQPQYASIATPSPPSHAYEHAQEQEMLSPSPIADRYDAYNMPQHYTPALQMQRSASASSSFHIPSPHLQPYSHVGTPLFGASPSPQPDWAAMQLAQSYLPSLSPVAIANSPFMAPIPQGRNTPSPLPTLGELRTLQRSNSAAARARAMDKLTGGSRNPSPMPPSAEPSPTKGLQRADSLGARGPSSEIQALSQSTSRAEHLPSAFHDPRPRLQRSFTVSSSNMGEERRSAVGRRMVARLANRAAENQEEMEAQEAEVRRLWEERTGRADPEGDDAAPEPPVDEDDSRPTTPPPAIPDLIRHSPPDSTTDTRRSPNNNNALLPPDDRPGSRNTQMSEGDAFEYASLLSRSLSARTARGAKSVAPENDTPAHTPLSATFDRPESIMQRLEPESGNNAQAGSPDTLDSRMFIMGRNVSGTSRGRQVSIGFPVGVEDSEWGTPTRSGAPVLGAPLQPAPSHSYSDHDETGLDPSLIASDHDSLTPPGISTRNSVGSWEEVGGEDDREVPIDTHYHKKSGSFSAKVGRAVQTMRKRSQSRSSVGSKISITSPPTSPQGLQVGGFSRRGSSSSQSPSQSVGQSLAHGGDMRHHPSISSLSPSLHSDTPNHMLLQHQLSNDPQVVRDMPRARMDDPRVYDLKLSPFPGVESASSGRSKDGLPTDPPRLLHQHSDSVIPSQQRVGNTGELHSLPLVTPEDKDKADKRTSQDSMKRSWLSKTFSSPRSSASNSRKSSLTDVRAALRGSTDFHSNSTPPDDTFTNGRSRPISPSVSTVPELNEDLTRMTQFTAQRSANQTPVHEESLRQIQEEVEKPILSALPTKSAAVLQRMDDLLSLQPEDPARPDVLDDPPRKLLLATQVLQVVNVHTAKDRFLLLFNDILVIAKPVIPSGLATATLDMKFIVKSIVALDQLQAAGFSDEQPRDDSAAKEFIARFARDPFSASRYLVERNHWKDATSLAAILFKTAELDKEQLGSLLATDDTLLCAYVDMFHFVRVRIDEALRIFLLAVALPGDPTAAETLLVGFARRYIAANADLGWEGEVTEELVFALMQLSDSLHESRFGFAMRNTGLTVDVFISAFRSKDPSGKVDDDTLEEVYYALEARPLSPPGSRSRRVQFEPAKIQSKLTYAEWSDPIRVRIAHADPDFGVRLLGDGLEFEPAYLDFSRSDVAEFRVRGSALGLRSVLFARVGANAALYGSLGNAKMFNVERAFMKHTFHVAFANHLGLKRKYCFSVLDHKTRARWGEVLPKQINAARDRVESASMLSRVQRAAQGVSLLVLRDALIPPPEVSASGKARVERTGSVSSIYALVQGKGEAGLGPLHAGASGTAGEGTAKGQGQGQGQGYANAQGKTHAHTHSHSNTHTNTHGMMEETSGKEVVLVCRQNSLLPDMLELLSAGIGAGAGEVQVSGTGKANGQGHEYGPGQGIRV